MIHALKSTQNFPSLISMGIPTKRFKQLAVHRAQLSMPSLLNKMWKISSQPHQQIFSRVQRSELIKTWTNTYRSQDTMEGQIVRRNLMMVDIQQICYPIWNSSVLSTVFVIINIWMTSESDTPYAHRAFETSFLFFIRVIYFSLSCQIYMSHLNPPDIFLSLLLFIAHLSNSRVSRNSRRQLSDLITVHLMPSSRLQFWTWLLMLICLQGRQRIN